jgi:GT2 family glycosyltransferase
MNPCLMLTRNNLALTMRAAASVMRQSVRTQLYIVDNGSTDGTQDCLFTAGSALLTRFETNMGVSFGWNDGLGRIFGTDPLYSKHEKIQADHCLVINNDVVLPVWFYEQLLSYNKPFVSGVSVDKMEQIAEPAPMGPLHPHPDFSAFLIKREVWDTVGQFDESMKHYASDNDFHVRAQRAGAALWKANVPFYHERSSTINLATPEERLELTEQASKDRQRFFEKWGVMPWGPGYDALFG